MYFQQASRYDKDDSFVRIVFLKRVRDWSADAPSLFNNELWSDVVNVRVISIEIDLRIGRVGKSGIKTLSLSLSFLILFNFLLFLNFLNFVLLLLFSIYFNFLFIDYFNVFWYFEIVINFFCFSIMKIVYNLCYWI